MLEASGFDFRNRHPQKLLVKLLKQAGLNKESEVGIVAYCISLDLYRTFAPLKQTMGTMAFACLELASRLLDADLHDVEAEKGYDVWKISRAEVMGLSPPPFPLSLSISFIQIVDFARRFEKQADETVDFFLETLLDLLDLYIHHRASTVVGPDYSLETFLAIRIPLNKESEDEGLPRFTHWRDMRSASSEPHTKAAAIGAGAGVAANGTSPGFGKQGKNKHKNKSKDQREQERERERGLEDAAAAGNAPPPNPLTSISANGEKPSSTDRGRDGTVRFMLDVERAEKEKRIVSTYFRDTIEEVEE